MRNPLFDLVESKYRRSNELEFAIGDTVVVTLKIAEGDKERLQDFEGVVVARRGRGLDEMFIVRRLVGDEGVERVFPLHSPKIASIKVRRSGQVRRGKLYFLRNRVGKARKLRERRITAEAKQQSDAARRAKQEALAEADRIVARAEEGSRKKEMAAT